MLAILYAYLFFKKKRSFPSTFPVGMSIRIYENKFPQLFWPHLFLTDGTLTSYLSKKLEQFDLINVQVLLTANNS